MKYVKGQEVVICGSLYLVQNTYEMSAGDMAKYSLCHRDRVTLIKISGEGADKLDFANTDY